MCSCCRSEPAELPGDISRVSKAERALKSTEKEETFPAEAELVGRATVSYDYRQNQETVSMGFVSSAGGDKDLRVRDLGGC